MSKQRAAAASSLADLIKEAASRRLHGMCFLSYDHDCYQPPNWKCRLNWWIGECSGQGDTPEEAIRAAMAKQDATPNIMDSIRATDKDYEAI